LRALVLTAVITSLSLTGAHAQDWSEAPFRTPTPVPRDGLPPDREAFLRWLAQSSATLTQQDAQRAQVRLYTYISELAKHQGGRFPAPTDTAAFAIFRAAASLGAPGADLVARALYPHPERLPAPAAVPSFHLTFQPPLFKLASDDGSWGVCYPYYFMAAPAGRQRPTNGALTEIVILSTLTAPDQGPAGSSQATIMLAAAPLADSARHVNAWLTQFGLWPTSPPSGAPAGAWYAGAPGEPMNRLAVIERLPKRILILVYLGLSGTFESNRPHFFNVLTTATSGQCAV